MGSFNLLTRDDLDGIICAVLLNDLDLISSTEFVHPNEIQSREIPISDTDILCNLPYHPDAHLVFDHHISEAIRVSDKSGNYVVDPSAPSAARVIFNHYGGRKRFPHDRYYTMLDAVDRADSGAFERHEIIDPHGWMLLHFLTDPKTDLNSVLDFKSSHGEFLQDLVALINRCDLNIEEVLREPFVQERVNYYRESQPDFVRNLRQNCDLRDRYIVYDRRNIETKIAGNRFMMFVLYPDATCSIQLDSLPRVDKVRISVGKSIFNKSSMANIGKIMLSLSGGGHESVGSCTVPHQEAGTALEYILSELQQADAPV
ncbi:MAG: exopolyphosphatase [Magnetovibrionaceae bacterium]